MEKLHVAWIAFGLYAVLTMGLAILGMRKTTTLRAFALGNQDLGPLVTGVTLAAAIASTATFVINPGFVYAHGLSALMHLGVASFAGVIFGLVIFSKGFRAQGLETRALTMPHWIERRYGSRAMRTYFALLNLVLSVSFVVLIVKGSALVMQHTLGTSYLVSLAIIVGFVFSYVLIGGTYAHVFTNALQGGIMVVVAIAIVGSGLHLLSDGLGSFFSRLGAQDPNLLLLVNPESSLFGSVYGVYVAGFVVGVGLIAQPHILTKSLYLRTDQQVNRYLLIGSVVCVIYTAVLLAGLYARLELPNLAQQDAVMPIYLAKAFSPVVGVLVSVALLAAGMSTLDGILVSASTIAANDLFLGALGDRLLADKSETEREAMAFKASRYIVAVMGVVAFALALEPPKLVGLFAQVGVYGLVVASIVPISLGILTKTASAREVFPGAVLGPIVHFAVYGVVVYGQGEVLNPAISASFGVFAGLALSLGLLSARRAGAAPSEAQLPRIAALLVAVGLGLHARPAHAAGTFEEVTGFGGNPGNLRMYRYVPEDAPANAPLVVVLHTCYQGASDQRRAGWESLADTLKFYLLYPEQKAVNNALTCWNWAGDFSGDDNLFRGRGENQSIIDMVDHMKASYSVDPRRVFVTGQSAGGAQAALMIALWPDVFAGAGILSGIPYHCSNSLSTQAFCLSPGVDRSPAQWGDLVRNAYVHSGPYPKVSIWHGSSDFTVLSMNQTELLEQWTNVHGIDTVADRDEDVAGARRREYRDAQGEVLVETYVVSAGHGTFVDPGRACGQSGLYFLDAGICSAAKLAEFFGLSEPPSVEDITAPVVGFASPTPAATVSGTVRVEVNATDAFGVESIELSVGGVELSASSASPLVFDWDTSAVVNGEHTLEARARDASGNVGRATVTVTVQGGIDDLEPPVVRITSHQDGATLSGTEVIVEAEATDDSGVVRVELLFSGYSAFRASAPPYRFTVNTSFFPEGAYTLAAKAVDRAGREGFSTPISVTITKPVDTLAPLVYVLSPAPGEKVSGVVPVRIAAVDNLSGVEKVELWVSNQLVGTSSAAPYVVAWSTDGLDPGVYKLVVRAIDEAGNLGQNDETSVQVGELTEPMPPDPEPTPTPTDEGSWGCSASQGTDASFSLLLGLFFLFALQRSNRSAPRRRLTKES